MWTTTLKSIAAGIMIGIGSIIYLSCDNKYVGAVLFGLGLYTIIAFQMNLFTGKVGYVVQDHSLKSVLRLPLIWVGNFIGATFSSGMICLTRVLPCIAEKASALCEAKLNDYPGSIFILSVFCGALMYIAVEGYARLKNPLIVLLAVTVFILTGFEHCIANMAYFTIAQMWDWQAAQYIGIMTLGNACGGIALSAISMEAST